jgi:UDP-2,3-diacylglucosamine hydrolase
MRALFISDLHLSDSDPVTHAKFLAFARGPARAANRLYILGDLFHHWLGDGQIRHDTYAAEVVRELRAVSASGCEIALLVGNRDFMIGQEFCTAIGARFLDGPTREMIDGREFLLLHGDELCTDDIGYQKARKILRHPFFKPAVAPLPYFLRIRIAQYLRRKSASHKRTLSTQIMDVTENAVAEMFRREYPYASGGRSYLHPHGACRLARGKSMHGVGRRRVTHAILSLIRRNTCGAKWPVSGQYLQKNENILCANRRRYWVYAATPL